MASRLEDQYSYNTVYLNQDNKYYNEVGFYTGLAATEWSWSPVFIDVDLDGFEDFLITTGHPLDMQDMDVTNEGERLKNTRKRTARELLEMRFICLRIKILLCPESNDPGLVGLQKAQSRIRPSASDRSYPLGLTMTQSFPTWWEWLP